MTGKKRVHDMLNDLSVAMGLVRAFADEKLEPTGERYAEILDALEHVASSLAESRTESRDASVGPSESVLSAIVEGSPYAKVLIDGDGLITLVNAEAEKLFGYGRSEMLGRSVEMLVPPRLEVEHTGLRRTYNRRPHARPMGAGRDLYGRRKDGSDVPVEIGLNPIVTDAGSFTIAAISDITERKRAEQMRLLHVGVQQHATDLEHRNSDLADASRFKTEFISTMSHELRTPLAAIIGGTELLENMALPARASANVATIHESAEALFALIGSILDFSKIEAGKMDLQVAPLAVESVVESAVEVVAQVIHGKDVALHAYVDPTIPLVSGDGGRLRQILLNLLGNAAKFTDSGHIVARALRLEAEPGVTRVRFEIQDTGCGIAPEFMPYLFEPFAQGRPTDEKRFGGSGLGLSISKRLVELMGGTIGIVSDRGAGSLFWFTAAFATIDDTIVAPVDTLPATQRSGTPRGPVLVAEDDARLRRLLEMQFEDLGIEVSFVADGRAAVDAARDAAYAMIVMDCQMPHLDGISATRAIRKAEVLTGGHVAIVAMTANAFAEDREECLAAGMDDYLSKPVRLAELRAIVERWSAIGEKKP